MRSKSLQCSDIISGGTRVNEPVFMFCEEILGDVSHSIRKTVFKKISSSWFKTRMNHSDSISEFCADLTSTKSRPKRHVRNTPSVPTKVKPITPKKIISSSSLISPIKIHQFRIESNLIFDQNGKFLKGWTSSFYQKFAQIEKRCMIVIKHKHSSKDMFGTPIQIAYGKCKFPNCLKFHVRFNDIFNEMASVEVFKTSVFNQLAHDSLTMRRQIRNSVRENVGEELKKSTGTTVRNKLIKSENIERMSNGNIDFTGSIATLRKIKQEIREKNDHDKDDIQDVKELKNDLAILKPSLNNPHPQYIRKISEPFHCSWYCDGQLRTLRNMEITDLYFDATGSVVRKSTLYSFIILYV